MPDNSAYVACLFLFPFSLFCSYNGFPIQVASCTGERQAIDKYDKSLLKACRSGVQSGLASGLGSGVFMFFVFCTYSMAVWYGAKMIIHKDYTGGQVMNVIAAVLTASL